MELESDFEALAEQALLANVATTLRDEHGPLLKDAIEDNFKAYAAANDYDISFIWEAAEDPVVKRSQQSVQLRIEWPGLTALFELGVEPHTITGDLHFYWEAKDMWIQTDSVNWGSETGGIPESRAIRNGIEDLRQEIQR
ncbi:hypothetical protein C453_12961 [Haloferax elongans ATCC BAA-1513]|uniref:Uncharacterized protein n=1 Tax=Haloferax elongans ATCC BAA-1513 TaxID=1230453 RepID=M0HL64_HALEO|nr:hypothetical protein [Haloferax elongans]ELZ84457.1 hypothetical protein C453_12961 [Haloferax elongans ATCC BAA-1513]